MTTSFLLDFAGTDYATLAGTDADLIVYESAVTSATPWAPLSTAELQALEDQGRTVIGYVNTSVTDHLRAYWNDAWVAWTDPAEKDVGTIQPGAPDWLQNWTVQVDFYWQHAGYDAYLVDYADSAWQDIVIAQAEAVVSAGYDGVFLDDVGRYLEAGWATGTYDASWAVTMIELVIDVAAAVRVIDPDAYVAVNSGINLVWDAGLTPTDPLWLDYLDAIDGVLVENQYINEGPEDGAQVQDALSVAVDRFAAEDILSVEDPANPIDFGAYLLFSGNKGILPYVPDSGLYDGFAAPPVMGTKGHDVLAAPSGGGIVAGLGGHDTITGSQGDDQIWGHWGDDVLAGWTGDDSIQGNKGDDWLYGRKGHDKLVGGAGNDSLLGGPGNDTLTGGGGADHFLFETGDGWAVVTDFTPGTDVIEVHSGATQWSDLTFTDLGSRLKVQVDDVTFVMRGVDEADLGMDDIQFL